MVGRTGLKVFIIEHQINHDSSIYTVSQQLVYRDFLHSCFFKLFISLTSTRACISESSLFLLNGHSM